MITSSRFSSAFRTGLKVCVLSFSLAFLCLPSYAGCFVDSNGNTICCDENGYCKKVQQ